MPFIRILAFLFALPALGQSAGTNLAFFQKFVAGEVPVREILWSTRAVYPEGNTNIALSAVYRCGWQSNTTFVEMRSRMGTPEEMNFFMGMSRKQFWSVRPLGIEIVDRDRAAPDLFCDQSEVAFFGRWALNITQTILSLGLPEMELGTVRWNVDGSFSGMETRWLSELDKRLLKGRITRMSDAGRPMEIEFKSGFDNHSKRITYLYGTNLGAALPDRVLRFESADDPRAATSELTILKVSLGEAELPSVGYTPQMFAVPNWSTDTTLWTNSTRYFPGGGSQKYYRSWASKWLNRWKKLLKQDPIPGRPTIVP